MIRRIGTPPIFLGLAGPVTAGTVRLMADTTNAGSVRLQPDRSAPDRDVRHAPRPVAALLRPPPCARMERDRRDRAVASRRRRRAQQSHRVERRADRRRHAGRLRRKAEPGEPSSGRGCRAVGRHRRADGRDRRAWTQDAGRLHDGDDAPRVIVASDLARHLAFAVRWAGTEPVPPPEMAAAALDRAGSAAEFTAAVARWKMPARVMTLVESGGRRASVAAGIVRRRGRAPCRRRPARRN